MDFLDKRFLGTYDVGAWASTTWTVLTYLAARSILVAPPEVCAGWSERSSTRANYPPFDLDEAVYTRDDGDKEG